MISDKIRSFSTLQNDSGRRSTQNWITATNGPFGFIVSFCPESEEFSNVQIHDTIRGELLLLQMCLFMRIIFYRTFAISVWNFFLRSPVTISRIDTRSVKKRLNFNMSQIFFYSTLPMFTRIMTFASQYLDIADIAKWLIVIVMATYFLPLVFTARRCFMLESIRNEINKTKLLFIVPKIV